MPNLVGLSILDASVEPKKANLTANTTYVISRVYGKDVVVSQKIDAGKQVKKNSTILIEVSSGTHNKGENKEYDRAKSYDELLKQIENAILDGNVDYIEEKIRYESEIGELRSYPVKVIDEFVSYMGKNPSDRNSFMKSISYEKYSYVSTSGDYLVKLPLLRVIVNMGYDNTSLSIDGFNEVYINTGQSAEISPLLPYKYTLTISNPEWVEDVVREIPIDLSEPTTVLNVGP